MQMIVTHIHKLYGTDPIGKGPLKGAAMREVGLIENAWLSIQEGLIHSYGRMEDLDPDFEAQHAQKINAAGKLVLPAFIDSHTHIVFAATREGEFRDRIDGLTYEEIAERGGGILNSARRMQDADENELYTAAFERLMQCVQSGTGAIEIKSGYGLSTESEMKMLRVIKRLKETAPIPVKATFLGAHAIPAAYKSNRAAYIQMVTDDMLPKVAAAALADYCDVFCDQGFFAPDETAQILKAAAKLGIKARIHANELGLTGGVQVGVAHQALSVDHLEYTSESEIEALKNGDTMPTLLPSTAFFLGIPYPNARGLMDAGLPVCLASDYNPGSSPGGRMSFVMSLGCIRLRMTPEEALNACTRNAAVALELDEQLGSITPGKKGSILITKPAEDLALLPYSFATDHIERVIIAGKEIS